MQSRWWWIANKRVAAPRPALLEKSRKKKRKAIGQGRQFRRKKKKRKRKRRILPLQSSAVWPLPLQACCLFPCFSPPYFFCLPLNVQPPFFQATRFFCPSNAYFFSGAFRIFLNPCRDWLRHVFLPRFGPLADPLSFQPVAPDHGAADVRNRGVSELFLYAGIVGKDQVEPPARHFCQQRFDPRVVWRERYGREGNFSFLETGLDHLFALCRGKWVVLIFKVGRADDHDDFESLEELFQNQ